MGKESEGGGPKSAADPKLKLMTEGVKFDLEKKLHQLKHVQRSHKLSQPILSSPLQLN